MREISVAAAILINPEGRTLLVRKRGTLRFMQPGGKPEAGESFVAAAAREIGEELGLRVAPAALTAHGVFTAPAANEPDTIVVAHVFSLRTAEAVRAAAEIEEAVWIDPREGTALPLAALTAEHLLPLARRLAAEPEAALV
ncbi:DNA mismatch repair protein MutT [Aureimonas endophytica]|uniref:DNA mismatch repair protein MutT n=1 Tax=Aureimonas endophytica TaxID=2027858 RepID=A0A917ED39_9HYPH|nr:NUDIX domain-containing protein [Aureimonas endophytica]GGE23933.1 DNA mismatch repair protein MutT [Aureimonas endophytica]